MRIFVALPLPQTTKTSLASLCQTKIPGVRWEHPSDFHVTVRFIGDADSATYQRYLTVLGTVHSNPFDLTIAGTGRFPAQSSRPPKVLWAGLQVGPELQQLHRTVSALLEAQGLPKDKFDDYNPHVTLARCGQDCPLDRVDTFLQQNAAFHADPVHIDRFVVYQSERASDGGNYKEIATFPLR